MICPHTFDVKLKTLVESDNWTSPSAVLKQPYQAHNFGIEISTFCYVWCTICGGALDTSDDDGKKRSRIEIDDIGFLERHRGIRDGGEEMFYDGVWPDTYDSKIISKEDIEACNVSR